LPRLRGSQSFAGPQPACSATLPGPFLDRPARIHTQKTVRERFQHTFASNVFLPGSQGAPEGGHSWAIEAARVARSGNGALQSQVLALLFIWFDGVKAWMAAHQI
jgi:hypothetical protein